MKPYITQTLRAGLLGTALSMLALPATMADFTIELEITGADTATVTYSGSLDLTTPLNAGGGQTLFREHDLAADYAGTTIATNLITNLDASTNTAWATDRSVGLIREDSGSTNEFDTYVWKDDVGNEIELANAATVSTVFDDDTISADYDDAAAVDEAGVFIHNGTTLHVPAGYVSGTELPITTASVALTALSDFPVNPVAGTSMTLATLPSGSRIILSVVDDSGTNRFDPEDLIVRDLPAFTALYADTSVLLTPQVSGDGSPVWELIDAVSAATTTLTPVDPSGLSLTVAGFQGNIDDQDVVRFSFGDEFSSTRIVFLTDTDAPLLLLNAQRLLNATWRSSWFGIFTVSNHNAADAIVYSHALGFVAIPLQTQPDEGWFYNYQMDDWMWGSSAFPFWYYSQGREGWVFIDPVELNNGLIHAANIWDNTTQTWSFISSASDTSDVDDGDPVLPF